MILGKPWMEKNDVVYSARRRSLRFGSQKHGLVVRASGWYENEAPIRVQEKVSQVRVSMLSQITHAELSESLQKAPKGSETSFVGAISMHDITKALETRKPLTREEVRQALPEEVRHFTNLFMDDVILDGGSLPPHRPGIDTKVELLKDEQCKEREVPWGPLYSMSREELLVLRKTLTELIDKNWIRASSSPGGAPVLFIKKPGGG
ncbi:hypothetical protein K3495_g16615 [Podosphaera aphanis]|nr:hypothetical protein K3495_g16615 [Podosphaera aphanis]